MVVGAKRRVLFVEDDKDLRELLPELIRVCFDGYCETAASLEQLHALDRRALEFDVAILDINLGANRPSGIDAYRWLRERGFSGTILFLTGHARSHPMVEQAHQVGDATVLEKPITMQQLQNLLVADGPTTPPNAGGSGR